MRVSSAAFVSELRVGCSDVGLVDVREELPPGQHDEQHQPAHDAGNGLAGVVRPSPGLTEGRCGKPCPHYRQRGRGRERAPGPVAHA